MENDSHQTISTSTVYEMQTEPLVAMRGGYESPDQLQYSSWMESSIF